MPYNLLYILASSAIIFFSILNLNKYLIKKKLLDYPTEKKLHSHAKPKSIGIVIILILILEIIFMYFFNINKVEDFLIIKNIPRFYVFVISLLILFSISVYDDFFKLSVFFRLIIQFTLVILSLSSLPSDIITNLKIFNAILLPKIALIFYIYFWIFEINVSNFIDGIDEYLLIRLASNSILYLFIFWNTESEFLFFVSLLLFSKFIIGYYFNRFPSKAFLGDSGSIVIGYILGWFNIYLIYEGFIIEVLIVNYIFYLDILITHSKKIFKNESIFVRHNDFIFKKIFLSQKNKKKFYLFLRSLVLLNLFIALTIFYKF